MFAEAITSSCRPASSLCYMYCTYQYTASRKFQILIKKSIKIKAGIDDYFFLFSISFKRPYIIIGRVAFLTFFIVWLLLDQVA